MAQGIDRGLDFIPGERGRLFPNIFSQTIPGVAALALSGLFGVWIFYVRPAAVLIPLKRQRLHPHWLLPRIPMAGCSIRDRPVDAGLACKKLSA